MDPKKATNDKVIRDRKPDHTLISFFGDDSYGWFPKGRDIIPFEKNFAAKSKQPASKKVQHDWLCLLDTSVLGVIQIVTIFQHKHIRSLNSLHRHRPIICKACKTTR